MGFFGKSRFVAALGALACLACGKENSKAQEPAPGPRAGPQLEWPTEPALPDSPTATLVRECISPLGDTVFQSCPLAELPFLGEGRPPDAAAILERTAVFQPWATNRLRAALAGMPPEFFRLARALRGVVVHPLKTRMAYAETSEGILHLDPSLLCVTDAECAASPKLVEPSDTNVLPYRFRFKTRVVPATTRTEANAKSLALLEILLLHEVTHLCDTLCTLVAPDTDRSRDLASVWKAKGSPRISYKIPQLASELLEAWATTFYREKTIVDDLAGTSAAEIAAVFSPENAVRLYGFLGREEDLADNVSIALAALRKGTMLDVALLEAAPGATNADFLQVAWGQRDRIFEPRIYARVAMALKELIPEWNATEGAALMRRPQALPVGVAWKDALPAP